MYSILKVSLLPTVAMRYLFNSVHIHKRDYPEKLTQGAIISDEELSEHFKLSKRIATRLLKIAKDDCFNAQAKGKSCVTDQS